MSTLKFDDGSVQFRQRIAVAILSHRNLLIRNIRNEDSTEMIGLQNHEASFLRLIDALTNGSAIEINSTGTQLRFKPGVIIGGTITHECPKERSVSWFLEGIVPLLPFAKEASNITLTGITEGLCEQDPSMEYWKANLPKCLKQFGIIDDQNDDFMDADRTFTLQTIHRSSDGSGRIRVECPIIRSSLTPIDWTEVGKIKRIRGLVLSSHASTMARTAFATKGVLQQLIPDIWIHTEKIQKPTTNSLLDHQSRLTVTLTAESTTGDSHTVETAAIARSLPEDTGNVAAATLLQTLAVQGGGITSGSITNIILLWMCLTPEDVSRVRLGSLTPHMIESLRLYKMVFGVEFKITPELSTKTVLLSCLGTGYRNMARAST